MDFEEGGGRPKVWRSTLPGMWAWLLQRVSALLILLFLTLHFFLPYRRPMQFLLLLVVALHASLGIRVFLIDLGAKVKTQRILFALFLLAAASGSSLYGATCLSGDKEDSPPPRARYEEK